MTTPSDFITDFTRILCGFLKVRLPKLAGKEWWNILVFNKLSFNQREACRQHGYNSLECLDLLCLLRVFQQSFQELSLMDDIPAAARPLFYELACVRHRASHAGSRSASPDDLFRDLDTMKRVLEVLKHDGPVYKSVSKAREEALALLAPERVVEIERVREIAVEPDTGSGPPAGAPSIEVGDAVLYGPLESRIEQAVNLAGEKDMAEISVFHLALGEINLAIGFYDFADSGQMVTTLSRFQSPAAWDRLVKRLRIGVQSVPSSPETSFIQVRIARPKTPGESWPTRHMTTVGEINEKCGFDVERLLCDHGVSAIGSRATVFGETGRTRNQLCARFAAGDPVPAVLIYIVSTVLPYRQILEEASTELEPTPAS